MGYYVTRDKHGWRTPSYFSEEEKTYFIEVLNNAEIQAMAVLEFYFDENWGSGPYVRHEPMVKELAQGWRAIGPGARYTPEEIVNLNHIHNIKIIKWTDIS